MNRYLVASGNWNNTAIWSATSGGAGGASVPGAGDDALVDRNFTVTMTANLTVGSIWQSAGVINCGSSVIDTAYYTDVNSSTVKTLNMQDSTWNISGGGMGATIVVNNVKTTFNSQNSFININISQSSFYMPGLNYNHVAINLGVGTVNPITFRISGSPTFRSLIIQSKNSEAHTVNFSGNVNTTKFVAIGSSSSKKLTIAHDGAGGTTFDINGSSYGQFVHMDDASNVNVNPGLPSSYNYTKPYIGSNSSVSLGDSGWLLQDPPKIDTLIDTFTGTTLNSTLWTASTYKYGSIIQNNKLTMGYTGGSDSFYQLQSKDTYNLATANLVIGIESNSITNYYSITQDLYLEISPTAVSLVDNTGTLATAALPNYVRLRYASGVLKLDTSANGTSWTTASGGKTIDAALISSVRVNFSSSRNMTNGYLVLSAINPVLGPSVPVASFTSTATSGNTPLTVTFTDTSSGIPTSWLWTLGDGTTSTAQNPSKTYSAAGTYTVSLQATNSLGNDTFTKSSYITVSPNVYSREAKGTLTFGGSVSRKLKAYRQAKGTLTYGGSAYAFIRKNTDAIENKTYLYKVYDPTGEYVEIWSDVISEPNFTQEINSTGSTMQIDLARNSDSLASSLENILDSDGASLLDSSGFTIVGTSDQRNQVGPGSSVVQNNRVDVLVYYGSVEPLLDSMEDEILDSSGDTIDTTLGAPNGIRLFTGYISEVNTRYGSTENTTVLLNSYGADLAQYPLVKAGNTTVTFNSYDPSNIAKESLDLFITQSNLEEKTYTTYTPSSISTTGATVSYTFKSNTYEDVLKKTVELMPANWYFYVDLGNNQVVYRQKSVTATHTFLLGKHISSLDLKSTINNSYNRVLFTGGGDPALYKDYKVTPAANTRRKLYRYSDSRVTVVGSADALSEGIIDENNKVQYRTTLDILDKTYDIESIKVGDTVMFRNFGNYVDEVIMQVVGYTYAPDIVQLQLDSLPPTVNKRLEDVRRGLMTSDNETVPVAPI